MTLFKALFARPHRAAGQPHFPANYDGTGCWWFELDPGNTCPDCGGDLRLVGEDVSEILEMITAKLKVIEVARPKKSCRCCEKMVQAPAPSRPISGSMAGGSLLAYVLVSKFDDHLPLYRQNEILARMGADIHAARLPIGAAARCGSCSP